jgi:hypothetical protein
MGLMEARCADLKARIAELEVELKTCRAEALEEAAKMAEDFYRNSSSSEYDVLRVASFIRVLANKERER